MFTLTRFAHLPTAEIGRLTGDGIEGVIWTLELPWRDNRREVSCIPVGKYKLRRWASARHPVSLEILGEEPERSAVLIHPANRTKEIRGCIALGRELGGMPESPVLGRSKAAVQILFDLVAGGTFELEIVNGSLLLDLDPLRAVAGSAT